MQYIQQNWTLQKPYCIYKHISPSDKIYIGQTKKKRLHDRWGNGQGYVTCKKFYNAIKRYGWENIQHEIIKTGLTKSEADELEIQLISKYRELGICYNITRGGEGCVIPYVPDRIAKLRVSQSGRKYVHKGMIEKRVFENEIEKYINDGWLIGRRDGWSQQCSETIRRIGHPLKGRKQSPGHRLKNKLSHIGQKPTDLARKRCSEACKGRISPTKNTTGIHKNGVIKFISKNEIQSYMDGGWSLGTGISRQSTTKNKIRITNGIINKMVDANELDYYIREGWMKGELPRKKYQKRI